MRTCDFKAGDLYMHDSVSSAAWFVLSVDKMIRVIVLWGPYAGKFSTYPTSENVVAGYVRVFRDGVQVWPR